MHVSYLAIASIAMMLAISPASAEKRVFIITSNAGGYGVDRCLASGGKCGDAIATSYCHSKEFSKALSFRKVDRDDITGAIPGEKQNCPRGVCEDYVAIECSR